MLSFEYELSDPLETKTFPVTATTNVAPFKNWLLFKFEETFFVFLLLTLFTYLISASLSELGESEKNLPPLTFKTILFPENLINFASKVRPSELVQVLKSSSATQILHKRNNAKIGKRNFTSQPNHQQSPQSSHEDKITI